MNGFAVKRGGAECAFDGAKLTVTTGRLRREWRVVPGGLATTSLRRWPDGDEWIAPSGEAEPTCDWRLFQLVESDAVAELTAAEVRVVPREGVVGEHLETSLVFNYAAADVQVRHVVWVFPDAVGLRTRIDLRALQAKGSEEWPGYLVDSYAERLRLPVERTARLAAGYYNDTQHRNSLLTPMLKEERREGALIDEGLEVYDWANLLHLRRERDGLALVKESHKCVNQEGVDTGAFVLTPDGVRVTGLGWRINGYNDPSPWIRTDAWHEGWANWCVLYAGGEAEGCRALKEFDRTRFGFDPARDVYMNANTWGSRGAGDLSRAAAAEESVLKEIASCADLGIDMLQIDDGWEFAGDMPFDATDWRPVPERYPEGWAKVRAAAEQAGVTLGLWFAWTAPIERIKENCDEGGFLYLKMDYANLAYRYLVDELLAKAREIDRHNGYRGRINWDLTEVAPRIGWFLGREYGHLFVRNTQWTDPTRCRTMHVDYLLEVLLRDAWEYARHLNLNQIYLNVQNKDRFAPTRAGRYSHAYCFAIAMMGIPTFFQETQFYDEAARTELRPLIALYKQHREKILAGWVSPVGARPNGHNWTGFHCETSADEGYLTVFREIDCPDSNHALRLPSLPTGNYEWQDLLSNETTTRVLDSDRTLECTLNEPGCFLFLRYRRKT